MLMKGVRRGNDRRHGPAVTTRRAAAGLGPTPPAGRRGGTPALPRAGYAANDGGRWSPPRPGCPSRACTSAFGAKGRAAQGVWEDARSRGSDPVSAERALAMPCRPSADGPREVIRDWSRLAAEVGQRRDPIHRLVRDCGGGRPGGRGRARGDRAPDDWPGWRHNAEAPGPARATCAPGSPWSGRARARWSRSAVPARPARAVTPGGVPQTTRRSSSGCSRPRSWPTRTSRTP